MARGGRARHVASSRVRNYPCLQFRDLNVMLTSEEINSDLDMMLNLADYYANVRAAVAQRAQVEAAAAAQAAAAQPAAVAWLPQGPQPSTSYQPAVVVPVKAAVGGHPLVPARGGPPLYNMQPIFALPAKHAMPLPMGVVPMMA